MTEAVIALGANLGEPKKALEQALKRISKIEQTILLKVSSFYRTAPVDSSGPDYVNAVVTVETELEPEALLRALFVIENEAHRVRPEGVHNAPRTLDLDLLLYGDVVHQTPFLTLPHPRMHERAFVLVPLLEIEPDCRIPGKGPAGDFLESVKDQAISREKSLASNTKYLATQVIFRAKIIRNFQMPAFMPQMTRLR